MVYISLYATNTSLFTSLFMAGRQHVGFGSFLLFVFVVFFSWGGGGIVIVR